MKAALLLGQVLTCLLAGNLYSVYGQATTCCENCCDNVCPAPPPINVTVEEFVAFSPLYITVLPAIATFAGTDSVCLTYAELPEEDAYLLTISTVYSNGFIVQESFIKTQEDLGRFVIGSSTCTIDIVVFDVVFEADCVVFLAYLCFSSDQCSFAPGNDIPVVGFSDTPGPISEDCLEAVEETLARDGIPDQEYFILPYSMDTACEDENCVPVSQVE